MSVKHRKYHKSVAAWPNFAVAGDNVDGLVPSTCVKSWQHFQEILKEPFFNRKDCELIYRGQRRFDWGLTPTIARYTDDGTFTKEMSQKQIENFRLSIRGRTSDSTIQDDEDELWALGQHHGLQTHLLDWTKSPYVAMFFAFEEANSEIEKPTNYSRTVFVLNKTGLEQHDGTFFVQPLKNDHNRLINQAGLLTRSPDGENTLETYIINTLGQSGVDVDSPEELSEFICKIHIPVNDDLERVDCFRTLRKMNLHHASLFPDLVGSSSYCNELLSDHLIEKDTT